jgi:phosphohistidine swiveling domain-containing protein
MVASRDNVRVRDHRDAAHVIVRDHRTVVRDHENVRVRVVDSFPAQTPEEIERGRVTRRSDAIRANDNMSIEDKLTELLILLSGSFDRDIDNKMKEIQGLEGKLKNATGDGKAEIGRSIDREMLNLNRLITKRDQLFKMLEKTLEVYKESASNAIRDIKP